MRPLATLLCAFLGWADPPAAAPPASSPLSVVSALESALGDAIEKAEPSVVAIARVKSDDGGKETTAVRGNNADNHRDPRLPVVARGVYDMDDWISNDFGSGVVIGPKGAILTAFHVVKGASRLEVRAMGRQHFEAEVIAADPRYDLAVIAPREIEGIGQPKLQPIALGDPSKLRKGSFLVALGNPFNAAGHDGRPSASWGILSNIARRLIPTQEEQNSEQRQLRHFPTLLQLDAKLNLGMGGGAVVNLKGELVGITTAAASVSGFDTQAGYAIPLDTMGRRAVEELRVGKEVEYGFLGIELDDQGTSRVKATRNGTPAALGDVLTDDVIVSVNGTPVKTSEELMMAINVLPAGAQVHLKINRQGELLDRTVELGKYPIKGEKIVTNRPSAWRGLRVEYWSQNPDLRPSALLTTMGQGVWITEVEPGSPAEKAGLKRDQVITAVGKERVRSPRSFAKIVAGLKGPVTLQTDLGEVTVE